MRIAICLATLNLGGIGTVADVLARGFRSAGHQPKIILTYRRGNFFSRAKDLGWPVENTAQDHPSLRRRIELVHRELVNHDVVLVNHALEAQLCLPALPPSTVRIIVQHTTRGQSARRYPFTSGYYNFWAGVSPAVVNVASATLLPGYERYIVLPNGIDLEVDPSPVYRFNLTELRLLFVGRLDPTAKNILLIPEILEHLKRRKLRFRMTFAGEGPGLQDLKEKLRRYGVDGACRFVGSVERREAHRLMCQHDIALSPSHWEGFGLVVVEAMAAGVIPIASDIPAHRYVLGDHYASLVAPINDAAAYADRIVELINSPEEARRIRAALMERHRVQFSERACVDNYLRAIEQARKTSLTYRPVDLKDIPMPLEARIRCTWPYLMLQRLRRHVLEGPGCPSSH